MPFRDRMLMTGIFAALGLGVLVVVYAHENSQNQPLATAFPAEAPFIAENEGAMTKMMNDMAATPTGDIDRDFVAMMAPHHQGAIDMAEIELRYGKNEQLRRISQEIIVDQLQEIAAMRLAIGDPPPSVSSPTQPALLASSELRGNPAANSHDHMQMSPGMNMK